MGNGQGRSLETGGPRGEQAGQEAVVTLDFKGFQSAAAIGFACSMVPAGEGGQ